MSVQYAFNTVADVATLNTLALSAFDEYVRGKSCGRRKDCPGEDLDSFGVEQDRNRVVEKFEKTRRRNKRKIRLYLQRALNTSNQRGTALKRSGDVSQELTFHRDVSFPQNRGSHA